MDFGNLRNKRVLVAGGAGLLGIALTERLVSLGVKVTSSSFFRQPPARLKKYYQRYDFTRFEDCLSATKDQDYVLLGAVVSSGLGGSMITPTVNTLPNLQVHAGLMEACAQNKVEKVVWVSSAMIYQEAYRPIAEDQLDFNVDPHPHYMGIGWLFRYIEKLGKLYQAKTDLKVGILRTSNIYGPYDRFDDLKAHVLPALLKRALKQENPYVVWGNGHHVRDFVYVDDVVEAVLRMFETYCECDPLNFGGGDPITIRKLVSHILEICGHSIDPEYDSSKPTAIPYRAVDNAKATTVLGEIKRTSLRLGLEKTIKWYESEDYRD
jgi:GDP-L-fucose synthase